MGTTNTNLWLNEAANLRLPFTTSLDECKEYSRVSKDGNEVLPWIPKTA